MAILRFAEREQQRMEKGMMEPEAIAPDGPWQPLQPDHDWVTEAWPEASTKSFLDFTVVSLRRDNSKGEEPKA